MLNLDIDARGVAFVTLNRPEVHNAFDERLIAELTRTFIELEANDAVRLAVIAGEGKSFCAGGDLNWMRSMKNFSREENIADSERLSDMYATIDGFSKPLLGIVHGAALGGGSGLAAVCDFVIASEDAKFGFTETRLGILPAVIGPYAIRKIGLSNARAYFISGMPITAECAKEMGLAHRIVPRAELEQARDGLILEFLKAAPGAARKAKALIRTIATPAVDVTKETINAIVDARISAEGQEGMDALLTGRNAAWMP